MVAKTTSSPAGLVLLLNVEKQKIILILLFPLCSRAMLIALIFRAKFLRPIACRL